MFATVASAVEARAFQTLFDAWRPGDALVALPGTLSRSQVLGLIPKPTTHYRMKMSKAIHSKFGGVTTSTWHMVHFSRIDIPVTATTLMTENYYPQSLQSSLDDTEGKPQGVFSFEPCSGKDFIGHVTTRKGDSTATLRVYDGEGMAPDLSTISTPRFWFFWVLAATVWTRERILRPIRLHELFSVWDYECKAECKHRSWPHSMFILTHRIQSPPGKIIRVFAFHLLNARNDFADSPIVVPIQAGLSRDVPYSPLELTAEVRAKAACPDDADIDLSTWAAPDETQPQADARTCLRRLAVTWWAWYHSTHARQWLLAETRSYRDHAGVKDCISRIMACRYFKWPRGSRIFFWRIPTGPNYEGWLEDFRDGVKLLQLPNAVLPQGRMPNIPADTREHELLTREKILRLRVCRYLEEGKVKLVVPRFTVPKADGKDVRVVWDSKANGHNACLWAPSFLLGDSGDLEEMVVKWLSMPVGSYLKNGCPDEDYTQDASRFIKSWQADIDVGQQFNNFQAQADDRPYLGVRIVDTRNDGSHEKHHFMQYSVLHFGGKGSPYLACQSQLRILELAKLPPRHPTSHFRWGRVVLNLPTSDSWDPSLPRVLLLRNDDDELATQEVNYVDDIHPVSRGIDDGPAVRAAKQLKSNINSYGNQADDKKYRRPSCKPGAWKGEIMHTDQPFPRKSTTGKKWVHF